MPEIESMLILNDIHWTLNSAFLSSDFIIMSSMIKNGIEENTFSNMPWANDNEHFLHNFLWDKLQLHSMVSGLQYDLKMKRFFKTFIRMSYIGPQPNIARLS
jgi:hypothetical protein